MWMKFSLHSGFKCSSCILFIAKKVMKDVFWNHIRTKLISYNLKDRTFRVYDIKR